MDQIVALNVSDCFRNERFGLNKRAMAMLDLLTQKKIKEQKKAKKKKKNIQIIKYKTTANNTKRYFSKYS